MVVTADYCTPIPGGVIGSAAIAHFPDNGAGGLIGKARHCSTWALPDHQHLSLANPRPFPKPIPYRGRLGLWEFPDELLPVVADD